MLADDFRNAFHSYSGISEMLKQYTYEELITHITTLVNAKLQTLLDYPMCCCHKGSNSSSYRYVLEDLQTNINRYDKVYELLDDETSRMVFLYLIQFRLIPDAQFLSYAYDVSLQNPQSPAFNTASDDATDSVPGSIATFDSKEILSQRDYINTYSPDLAFFAHPFISDLWELPLLLHSIQPNYKLRLRHYHQTQNVNTVFYAIIQDAWNKTEEAPAPRTAVALPWREGWINVELTKDCGLIPYLLHKNHGMDVTMTGANKGPYPYLKEYVNGLQMYYLESGNELEKIKYIAEHGKEIDLLILRGAYDVNTGIALQYKRVNPKGKIYVGLDANSHWMDRILWDRPGFTAFMDCCDVIATSCRALQKHLNEKWPWKIEYIPNGYYDYGMKREAPVFSEKENTILTVSRLGTPQKATPVLMNAFALIADRIPEWNLKLVGSIDPAFQPFIDRFFTERPDLRSRIEFTGVISDKNRLFEEYRKAKIFALPSTFEGGTPNVVSEALTAGCVMAVTKFDAWEDAIDEGRCGFATEINNTDGFATLLLTLCKHPELEIFSRNSYDYAMRNYDMKAVVAKLYELLFGGDTV